MGIPSTMQALDSAIERMRDEIRTTEKHLRELRGYLVTLESSRLQRSVPHENHQDVPGSDTVDGSSVKSTLNWEPSSPLTHEEYQRYGRQMIMPEVGRKGHPTTLSFTVAMTLSDMYRKIGQIALKQRSVLIVGLGGLGCPAAAYLAAAGVGRIGLADGDTVDISNLHRQILHSSENEGKLKVKSVLQHLEKLNPNPQYETFSQHIEPVNAVEIFEKFDVILDCTDQPKTRYLLSDAAVLAKRPLVTASALKTEGQLMVLNNPPTTDFTREKGSFCYRCVFPKPPPVSSVMTCGEGGIIGPVVGVMGVLMATEAIKVLLCLKGPQGDMQGASHSKPTMLIHSAFQHPSFREIRLGGRRPGCPSCSEKPSITRDSLTSGSLDYVSFCGIRRPVDALGDEERISAKEFAVLKVSSASNGLKSPILVDVRERVEFDLVHLVGSINMPYTSIVADPGASLKSVQEEAQDAKQDLNVEENREVYFICRFGNDSQLALQKLRESYTSLPSVSSSGLKMKDIKGGLNAWRQDVDHAFPQY